MDRLDPSALDFSELVPLLQLHDNGRVPPISEQPNEQLVELIQTLDAELEKDQGSQQQAAGQVNGEADADDPVNQDSAAVSEGANGNKSQASTRVRTYTARKMEIAKLMEELPHLESYVDFLKHQAAAKTHNQNDSLQKTRLINSTLRESVYRQQLTLARLQSAMSFFRASGETRQERMVQDTFIQLPRDNAKRVETVSALSPKLLRDAKRFMRERTAFIDHDVQCTELGSFPSPSAGAWCVEKFAVYPIRGSATVKQVLDALFFFTIHMDGMLTEGRGDATTRESSSELFLEGDLTVSQTRMVRDVADGLKVEWNAIVSSQLMEDDDEEGRQVGVMAINSVAKDEFYPYAPENRLRCDITSALVVKTYTNDSLKDSTKKKWCGEHSGVVITHHSFYTVYPGDEPITTRQLSEACNRVASDGNLLFDSVKESVDDPCCKRKP